MRIQPANTQAAGIMVHGPSGLTVSIPSPPNNKMTPTQPARERRSRCSLSMPFALTTELTRHANQYCHSR